MQSKIFAGREQITAGNSKSFRILRGRYVGLLVRLTGTTASGQTLALSEIGSFRLQRNGTPIQAESFLFYSELADRMGGFSEATLPTAGATAASVFIPFFLPGVMNAMEVVSDDELKLFFDSESGLSTEFGANAITVDVYGIQNEMVAEKYELHVSSQDLAVSATGKHVLSLNQNNVGALYVKDSGGNVSTLQIDVDGRTVEPAVDPAVALAFADMQDKVESGANNLIPYRLGSGRELGAYLNTSVVLTPTFSTTGTLEVTYMSLQPAPNGRRTLSESRVASKLTAAKEIARRKLK